MSFDQMRIRSNLHHMETITYNKKSLSFFEDKRCWLSLNKSLPYGHYSLPEEIRSRPNSEELDDIPLHLCLEEVDDAMIPDFSDITVSHSNNPEPKRRKLDN